VGSQRAIGEIEFDVTSPATIKPYISRSGPETHYDKDAMSIIQAENLTKLYGTGHTAVDALRHVNGRRRGRARRNHGPSGCASRPRCI
jgi:hypothetical protein